VTDIWTEKSAVSSFLRPARCGQVSFPAFQSLRPAPPLLFVFDFEASFTLSAWRLLERRSQGSFYRISLTLGAIARLYRDLEGAFFFLSSFYYGVCHSWLCYHVGHDSLRRSAPSPSIWQFLLHSSFLLTCGQGLPSPLVDKVVFALGKGILLVSVLERSSDLRFDRSLSLL